MQMIRKRTERKTPIRVKKITQAVGDDKAYLCFVSHQSLAAINARQIGKIVLSTQTVTLQLTL